MDLFDEVRDELDKEKYLLIWKKYGKYIISAISIIVVLIAGYFFVREYKLNKNIKDSVRLFNALNIYQGKTDFQYKTRLEDLIKDSGANHKIYSIFKKADYYIGEKQYQEAYDSLIIIKNKKKIKKLYQDYAELMLNYLVFQLPSKKEYIDLLNQLSNNNIFYWNIIEIRALGYFQRKKKSLAINEINKILSEKEAPQEIKKFAIQLLQLIN